VQVLARGTQESSLTEADPADTPPLGQGFFYLMQQVTGSGPAGYGTETCPWPRVPDACDGGCPAAAPSD
jgi:hypothetical protein